MNSAPGPAVAVPPTTPVTSVAWFVETQRCALASLTAWMFMVPVFGLLLGVVVLAERPAGWTLVGLALVLLSMGVALIRTTPTTTAAGMPRHHPTQHHTDP